MCDMEDDIDVVEFGPSVNNEVQQLTLPPLSLPSDDDRPFFRDYAVSAANDLLDNGIFVETNKGLVCMTLKDALTSGVGDLKLSVEDLQNVAAQLITQNPMKMVTADSSMPILLNDVMLNVVQDDPVVMPKATEPGDSAQVFLQKPVRPNVTSKSTPASSIIPEHPSIKRLNASTGLPSTFENVEQTVNTQHKKRGGWPKGRKRKPELLENRPPKAPATGYVLFLNEKRKLFKDQTFSEVTKVLGHEWSKLSLEEKQKYLDKAEIDKKRYREELKAYRQSDAYQSYLNRKRMKNQLGNGTEESDMDATDEIDDEDNEELYCRSCDQWFTTLHNKKEHLYGRQHLQSIAGDFRKERLQAEQDSGRGSLSTSLDDSSLDGPPGGRKTIKQSPGSCGASASTAGPPTISDAVIRFMEVTAERERERERELRLLRDRLKLIQTQNIELLTRLNELKARETELKVALENAKQEESSITQDLYSLLMLPTYIYVNSDLEEKKEMRSINIVGDLDPVSDEPLSCNVMLGNDTEDNAVFEEIDPKEEHIKFETVVISSSSVQFVTPTET
ncbi:hypothetical protein J437_LFUL015680 [Ladona fulva]|uniref:HMG box domain-containing protein n=1 Tax=Ladona fulva TaxID=123851 RepID=A0A8K0KI76_LADFU|nr:hypothetical protein J437_LFUL015680 [Ladona fulva]